MQQFSGLPTLGVLFYGKAEELTPEWVGRSLADVVTVMGCLVPDPEMHEWMNRQWLRIAKIAEYTVETDDLAAEVRRRTNNSVKAGTHVVQMAGPFGGIEPPFLPPGSLTLDVVAAVRGLLGLDKSDSLRRQAELLYVASCSQLVFGSIYGNLNLKISLLITALEAELPGGKTLNASSARNVAMFTKRL